MSFFKRKPQGPLIPPVSEPAPTERASSYRSSNSATYVASRDGDPYNSTPSRYAPSSMSRSSSNTAGSDYASGPAGGPARNRGIADPYARGERNLDADRNELFAGYNPEQSTGSNRFNDGPPGRRTPPPGEEEEDDVEGIKQQTRFVKQESVNSTRNALRLAREAEETARSTLGRLADQSEKIANTERHLDMAKGHSYRAEDNAIAIKRLNKSIFNPSAALTLNSAKRRDEQERKRIGRLDEEREEREESMREIRETQNRVGRAQTYGRDQDDDGEGIGGSVRGRIKTEAQKEQRKRYQFEATASDDELEDEMDDNLNDISDMTKRLKALGTAMGQELDTQITRIERIEGKTVSLDHKVVANTNRLKKIK